MKRTLFIMLVLSLILYVGELYPQYAYSAKAYLDLHDAVDKKNLTSEIERFRTVRRTGLREQVLPEQMFTDSLGKEFSLYGQLIAEDLYLCCLFYYSIGIIIGPLTFKMRAGIPQDHAHQII